MELINLKTLRSELANKSELTNEEKSSIFKAAKEENRAVIKAEITKFYLTENNEQGALIVRGLDDLTCSCPTTVEINNSEFFLYKDFYLKIGNTFVTIFFNDVELFRIELNDIFEFDIWN